MINQVTEWIEFQPDEHRELTSRRINSTKKLLLDLKGEIPGDPRWGQKPSASVSVKTECVRRRTVGMTAHNFWEAVCHEYDKAMIWKVVEKNQLEGSRGGLNCPQFFCKQTVFLCGVKVLL